MLPGNIIHDRLSWNHDQRLSGSCSISVTLAIYHLMNLDQDRVPARLEEALILLDAALTQHEKDAWHSMTAAKMFDLQAQLARTLRTDWSLLDPDSPLRIYFRNLGLDDPEEVSLLLIDAYWRKHNNEPVPVEELVREYLKE